MRGSTTSPIRMVNISSALTARCFCHEIEHLDGHLFVERTDHLLTEEELEEYIQQEEGDDEE